MKKNNVNAGLVATVLYAILAVRQLTSMGSIVFELLIPIILTTVGYALLAVTPVIKKNPAKLGTIGASWLVIAGAYNLYRPLVYILRTGNFGSPAFLVNVLPALFALLSALTLLNAIRKTLSGKGKKPAKAPLAPAILALLGSVFSYFGIMIVQGIMFHPSYLMTNLIWVVISFLAPFFMAKWLVAYDPESAAEEVSYTVEDADVEPDDAASEELKAYKSLLDNGIISQEEYDAKREELFGK